MPTDFIIDKLCPITIMEPKIKTRIKFLQKIFIKLFGYKEVCTFPGSITFTVENAQWNEELLKEFQ